VGKGKGSRQVSSALEGIAVPQVVKRMGWVAHCGRAQQERRREGDRRHACEVRASWRR
jgi:hypothetical protein